MSRGIVWLVLAVCLAWAPPLEANTIIVNCAGGTPFETIQEGIYAAAEGDTVLVMPGVYTGALNQAIDCGGTNIVVRGAAGPDSTIVDGQCEDRLFYFHTGEDASCILDGFTLSNGCAERGGAIYCTNGSSPTFVNLVMSGNSADTNGGALSCDAGSSPSISHTILTLNVAGGKGGALHADTTSFLTMNNVQFVNNESGDDGAGLCADAGCSLSHCTFTGNHKASQTIVHGGGVYVGGGPSGLLHCEFSNNDASYGGGLAARACTLGISSCAFAENSSSTWGGGLYLFGSTASLADVTFNENSGDWGGGLLVGYGSEILIENSVVSLNEGGGMRCLESDAVIIGVLFSGNDGGGLNCGNGEFDLTGVTFEGNTTGYRGGGMYCDQYSICTLEDVEFIGNHAFDQAGAIQFQRNSQGTLHDVTFRENTADWWGGTIACAQDCAPSLTSVIFEDNAAGFRGGVLYSHGGAVPDFVDAQFIGNHAGDYGGAFYCSESSPTVSGSTFSGNTAGRAGGAVYCWDHADLVFNDVSFTANTADTLGGAVFCGEYSDPAFTNAFFGGNIAGQDGGAIYCDGGSAPVLSGAILFANESAHWGGGLYCADGSNPVVTSTTIARSFAGQYWGAGVFCSDSSPSLANTIIACSGTGGAMKCIGTSSPSIEHCCSYGNAHGDDLCGISRENMFEDPLFCNVFSSDSLSLADDSPCLPENNVWAELVGARGSGCTMSPVEDVFYACLSGPESVRLVWAISDPLCVVGINVYRSTATDGSFTKLNDEPIVPTSVGFYEDATVWPQTTFRYQLRGLVADGGEVPIAHGDAVVTTRGQLELRMFPPTPNPSSGEVSVVLEVPGNVGNVEVGVYSASGRVVRSLLSRDLGPGRCHVHWDGEDSDGHDVPSGVYFLRVTTGHESLARKLLVVR